MDDVQITAGEVIHVQLTSETFRAEDGRATPTGRITNRMRVFLRDDGGKERNFDFEGASIGVRDSHRIAVVRGRVKRVPEPVNLMLANFTTDERDAFEDALYVFLWKPPLFGPIWKAVGFAALVGAGFWLISTLNNPQQHPMLAIIIGLFFGGLAFPLCWWLAGVWDRTTGRGRYKKVRAAFLSSMEGRLRACARKPGPPAPPPASP